MTRIVMLSFLVDLIIQLQLLLIFIIFKEILRYINHFMNVDPHLVNKLMIVQILFLKQTQLNQVTKLSFLFILFLFLFFQNFD